MGLWNQLDAKQRRVVVVPVRISSSADDEEILMGAQAALQQALAREDQTGAVAELEKAVEQAAARVRGHWAEIELHAMPADEWDAAVTTWRAGDDGEINWSKALAPLLAESCVDPDGRDVERWQRTLARPEWSEGDRDALKRGLLQANVISADPFYPKG
ncbi:MAG: hypothetical protein ACJ72N_06855 [Labedaea sp.]